MGGSRKPSETQQAWNNAGTQGMRKDALRRAHQIARQRQQNPYERQPVVCICCGYPRDRRSYPVCDTCTAKRKQGLR